MRRPGEHILLTAGVIDIIFADNIVARIFQQRCKGIANHRAPAMSHMHGACRIRTEEHTSELQSLMRNWYAVICVQKKKSATQIHNDPLKYTRQTKTSIAQVINAHTSTKLSS